MKWKTARRSLGGAPFLLLFVACSSSESEPIVGVNDVAKACSITSAWTKSKSSECSNCLSLAEAPKCACESDHPEAGECSDQASAVSKEPTCDGVDKCVQACQPTDCACVDGCYANKATCRTLASARDGCLAQVCDAKCK